MQKEPTMKQVLEALTLDASDVSAILGVHPKTVLRWLRDDTAPQYVYTCLFLLQRCSIAETALAARHVGVTKH
jgi:hypothetical protein